MVLVRGVVSSKKVRGPQHNNNITLTIANVNQGIEATLKQDKSEVAMAPLGHIVATPVHGAGTCTCRHSNKQFLFSSLFPNA